MQPFSLNPTLPLLNQPGYIYLGLHSVTERPGAKNAISPGHVSALLKDARARGWSFNLLDPNPRKLIATFDDGRQFEESVSRLLDAFDMTALFFVCTDRRIASYPHKPGTYELTQDNRRYLRRRHIIGSHTRNHSRLSALSQSEQQRVISDSIDRFEKVFGFRPWCFSYPWGCYNGTTLKMLKAHGIRYAFLAAPGWGRPHNYLIPRLFLEQLQPHQFNLPALLRLHNGTVQTFKLLLRWIHAKIWVGSMERQQKGVGAIFS